uniref:Uncharacterized protein n=1 Tax=Strigamia maritima TaxID=126957 RepID=T1JIQ7_STRMM
MMIKFQMAAIMVYTSHVKCDNNTFILLMANSLWWTAKQRCKKNRHQEQTSAVESKLFSSHSLWSLVERAANSFERNTVNRIASQEIRLCKELILFWAEELRLQRENNLVRKNIRSLKRTVHTLQDRRHTMRMEGIMKYHKIRNINDLTEQVVNCMEMAESTDRNILTIDNKGEPEHHLTENLSGLNCQDTEKMQQDAAGAISISQFWEQFLYNSLQVPVSRRSPNPNAVTSPEQMDIHAKEVHPDESRERLSPKSPVFCPNPKIKEGSLSETVISPEGSSTLLASHVKSAILEKTDKNQGSTMPKPDIVVQDREISGFIENHHEATNEIMAIIENEVLYHIFPVQVILTDLGLPKQERNSTESISHNEAKRESGKSKVRGKHELDQAGASGAQQSSILAPPDIQSRTSIMSEDRRRDCQDTLDTYMHYMYGNEITPRTSKLDENDEISPRLPSDYTFIVSGEELLPRFDVVDANPQSAQKESDVNKKDSDNSLSSATTGGTSDMEETESKEMLILDLSIDNPNIDGASAPTYRPLSPDNAHSSEFNSDTSRSAVSGTDGTKRVHKRRSLQKLYMKSKTIRSTPQKMKKFFCFTVSNIIQIYL